MTHVLNPDKFIVETNIALMKQGREFDAKYNARDLSDDAMPALISSFESYSEEDAQTVVRILQERRCRQHGEGDLRSFNFGRRAASEAMSSVGLGRRSEKECKLEWASD
jgi:hypothetical protein